MLANKTEGQTSELSLTRAKRRESRKATVQEREGKQSKVQ